MKNGKSLVKIEMNFLGKLKKLLLKILKSNKKILNAKVDDMPKEQQNENKNKEFLEELRTQQKNNNLRIMNMAIALQREEIIEEDLCESELKEIREFYLEQIQEKKKSIESYKNKIVKIRKYLN